PTPARLTRRGSASSDSGAGPRRTCRPRP
ncbi:uncharacterized protein METZ01_LOCUS297547, partial [marine metagenome]